MKVDSWQKINYGLNNLVAALQIDFVVSAPCADKNEWIGSDIDVLKAA